MNKLEKIVIATHNPAKKERFKKIFLTIASEVLSLDDFNIKEKPAESGKTAEENAEIKAKLYSQKLSIPVFSEDEALYVDFQPTEKQPGVHVRRIEGKDEADDNRLFAYWEAIIANVPKEKRKGHWHIAYCLAFPNGQVKIASLNHPIQFFSPSSRIRIPGWPMSSLEGPVKFGKPHSELTELEHEELNKEADALILEKLKNLIK